MSIENLGTAVLFSTIIISNAVFERLFFRTPVDARLAVAAVLGITGIALIFWPEVAEISLEDETVVGILLVLASAVIGSLGNMTAIVNHSHRELPIVAVNAHSMAWSALASFVIALLLGREVNFSLAPGYLLSLGYLAIFGSSIAFGCYLALMRKIGSARAAYTSVLFPVVALLVSTLVEDYRWSAPAVTGILFIVAGNWLALKKPKEKLINE